jgi:hypothetical protein
VSASEGFSAQSKLRVQGDVIIIPKDLAVVYISESKSRKKSFINLKQFESITPISSRAIQLASAR